jgi:serine phosphatase RsbU (regulator of sigma subunit)
VLGVLLLCSHAGRAITPEQVGLAETLAAYLAVAALEARNFASQQEEAWITTVLLEVARHAAQPGGADAALQAVLQLTTLLAGTPWVILLVPQAEGDRLSVGLSSGLGRQAQDQIAEVAISPAEIGITPPYTGEAPVAVILPQSFRIPLDTAEATAVTLSDGRTLLGVLLIGGQDLAGRRLSLLVGIAHQISLRLENTHLIEEIATRRSLERELATARQIQVSFLPSVLPIHPGWELGTTWRVARDVGGDFYDFIPLPDGPDGPRWGIVIADVADKGVPAALFMALCRTLLRSVAISRTDPGLTLGRANELIFADAKTDLFVSVFYAVWEPSTGNLAYANGGHNPPLLFEPERAARRLTEHGMVLGVSKGVRYQTHRLTLPAGALLVLYTDGVTEAMDSNGQFFGLHRLENLILGSREWRAQTVADTIAERVSEFCPEPDLQDDLTAVVLWRER